MTQFTMALVHSYDFISHDMVSKYSCIKKGTCTRLTDNSLGSHFFLEVFPRSFDRWSVNR